MIVTDSFIKAMTECDASASGMIFGICTGTMPTLEILRRQYGVNDKVYFGGSVAPMIQTAVTGQGGDIVTYVTWGGAAIPVVGKGVIRFPFGSYTPSKLGFVFKDCHPTWGFVLWNRSNTNSSTAGISDATPAACYCIALFSVGDENSSADYKIVGGRLYAGSLYTPLDYSVSYAGTNVIA